MGVVRVWGLNQWICQGLFFILSILHTYLILILWYLFLKLPLTPSLCPFSYTSILWFSKIVFRYYFQNDPSNFDNEIAQIIWASAVHKILWDDESLEVPHPTISLVSFWCPSTVSFPNTFAYYFHIIDIFCAGVRSVCIGLQGVCVILLMYKYVHMRLLYTHYIPSPLPAYIHFLWCKAFL